MLLAVFSRRREATSLTSQKRQIVSIPRNVKFVDAVASLVMVPTQAEPHRLCFGVCDNHTRLERERERERERNKNKNKKTLSVSGLQVSCSAPPPRFFSFFLFVLFCFFSTKAASPTGHKTKTAIGRQTVPLPALFIETMWITAEYKADQSSANLHLPHMQIDVGKQKNRNKNGNASNSRRTYRSCKNAGRLPVPLLKYAFM